MRATRIIVFARAPIAGEVKTRLIPALGAAGAARLANIMLAQTLRAAIDSAVGPVELCLSGGGPAWQPAPGTVPEGVCLTAQGEGDLGLRMGRAAARALGQGERALLIGTDCPGLGPDVLRHAARALERDDAVLLPVLDGGYTLLGLNRYHASLFRDIPWSTPVVAAMSLARLQALGWSVAQLPRSVDIDRPEDLVHLPAAWGFSACASGPAAAPARAQGRPTDGAAFERTGPAA